MIDVRANLPRMIVFARVAELGSFTAAAKDLRMSRPAVSSAVASLEEELGVSLLQRSTRAVRVTRIGEVLLDDCRRVQETASFALREASDASERIRGSLRVRSPGGIVGERIIAPALAELVRDHGVELELECSDERSDPIAGDVDAVIRLGTARDSAMLVRTVGRTHDVVVAAPHVAQVLSEPASLRDFAWVVHSALPRRFSIGGRGRRTQVTMRSVTEVNDSSALLGLVMGGAGLGILPRAAIRRELDDGRLVEPFPGRPVRTAQLFVLLPTRRVPERVRLMNRLLARQLDPS